MTLTTISYGGGVQSTALLVLSATGHLPKVDAALFANVGDDSEHPATLAYVRDVAIPWAAERGIPVHELHRAKRDGTTETLMGRLTREGSRSLDIPVRMDNGAPGNRSCTADFKIRVVGKWLKAHGATADDPASVPHVPGEGARPLPPVSRAVQAARDRGARLAGARSASR